MKTIKISLSPSGLKKFKLIIEDIQKALTSSKLQKFIAEKCLTELRNISTERLSSYGYEENDIDASYYASCNKYEISNNIITIYNDSMIDISGKTMSETKKMNYPNMQLSLAKIVEYGIGYEGAKTPQETVEDWEYDVNEHGVQGWYYRDEQGNYFWTRGYQGRLIFETLTQNIYEKSGDWIDEYFEKELKD